MVFQIGRLKFRIAFTLVVFVLVTVMPVSATLTGTYYTVAPNLYYGGATVYIGEQQLNVTDALGTATTIGWWASAASLTNNPTAPSNTITFTPEQAASFDVSPTTFVGYTGDWYRLDPAGASFDPPQLAFRVADPTLEISVRDTNPNQAMVDVSGKSIPTGSLLKFQIGTNMYNALNADKRFPVFGVGGLQLVGGVYGNSDGYLDIVVKNASGTTLTSLYGDHNDVNSVPIALNVSTSPYLWGGPIGGVGSFVWDTGALTPTGEKAYLPGTYAISVQSRLNNMKDNYQSGSGMYTGKTVSETKTITLVPDHGEYHGKQGLLRPDQSILRNSNGQTQRILPCLGQEHRQHASWRIQQRTSGSHQIPGQRS